MVRQFYFNDFRRIANVWKIVKVFYGYIPFQPKTKYAENISFFFCTIFLNLIFKLNFKFQDYIRPGIAAVMMPFIWILSKIIWNLLVWQKVTTKVVSFMNFFPVHSFQRR